LGIAPSVKPLPFQKRSHVVLRRLVGMGLLFFDAAAAAETC
jgi:hypothetical protein